MAGFSQYTELNTLQAIFKSTAFPIPTGIRISLHSADPGDTGANELAATGAYARASRDPDPNAATNTSWSAVNQAAAASLISNAAAVSFPTATANWNSSNPIGFWGAWDTAGTPNHLLSGTITGGVVVLNTNTLTFDPTNLQFTID